MQTIGTILAGSTILRTMAQTCERWKRIEPKIRADLLAQDIELEPRTLPEILAKIHTGEIRGGKGICLIGSTGTGKSRRLKWAADAFGIHMTSASQLCDMLMEAQSTSEKDDILLCVPPRWDVVPEHFNDLIIDDIGTEPDGQKVYGTQRFLMEDAIMRRYEVFPRWKTHFTSNLSKDEIRARYGERVWSRLNEMVVFVTLSGKDRRIA